MAAVAVAEALIFETKFLFASGIVDTVRRKRTIACAQPKVSPPVVVVPKQRSD